MTRWRYVEHGLLGRTDLRISARYTAGPRPDYAVSLLALVEGRWTTIRLWDNSHGTDVHHMHRYTRAGGKRPPEIEPHPSPRRALAAAFAACNTRAVAILDAYLRS